MGSIDCTVNIFFFYNLDSSEENLAMLMEKTFNLEGGI